MDAYMRLLKTGPQTASEFAVLLKQPRSTTYFILDRLKEAGVVEEFEGSSAKVFRSVSPRELSAILTLHEKRIEQTMHAFERLIPQLEQRQGTIQQGVTVEWHEGKDAVQKMFTKSRKAGNTEHGWFIMYNPEVLEKTMSGFLNPDKYADEDTPYKELVVDSAFAREYQKKHHDEKNLQIRILPKEIQFESDIGVNGTTVHFTAFPSARRDALNMRVHNPVIARQFRQIFDFLWERSA